MRNQCRVHAGCMFIDRNLAQERVLDCVLGDDAIPHVLTSRQPANSHGSWRQGFASDVPHSRLRS